MINIKPLRSISIEGLNLIRQKIDSLDLSGITQKLQNEVKDNDKVAKMIIQYKNFLYLSYKSDLSISPSKDIDKVWHLHILDTHKYQKDCQNIFGFFLHHKPYYPNELNKEIARNKLIESNHIFEQEFGYPMVILPDDFAICGGTNVCDGFAG